MLITGGGLCTGGPDAGPDAGSDPRSWGPTLIPRYREKNSSSHPKNASLSSVPRFAQSIFSTASSRWPWLGGYPLAARLGGGCGV